MQTGNILEFLNLANCVLSKDFFTGSHICITIHTVETILPAATDEIWHIDYTSCPHIRLKHPPHNLKSPSTAFQRLANGSKQYCCQTSKDLTDFFMRRNYFKCLIRDGKNQEQNTKWLSSEDTLACKHCCSNRTKSYNYL